MIYRSLSLLFRYSARILCELQFDAIDDVIFTVYHCNIIMIHGTVQL